MSGLRRVIVVVIVTFVAFAWSASFEVSEVQERAIVLGLGIDLQEDTDNFVVTAEVVSPGNGSEQVGIFSKTVTAIGRSVGEAVARIGEKTGKEPSLGQCGVLVFGKSLYSVRDFSDVVEYFVTSDSFKENAVICCTENACQLLNTIDVLSESVSLSLVSSLAELTDKVAVPKNTLLKYARSQKELTKSGFLNKVEFASSQNTDKNDPDKQAGYLLFDSMEIFTANKFVGSLTAEEVKGFATLSQEVVGNVVSVQSNGQTYALRINEKQVNMQLKGDVVQVEVTLQVKLARADSSDVGGLFAAQSDREVSQEMLDIVQSDVALFAKQFVQRQQTDNFDVCGLHEMLRQKYGSSQQLNEFPTSQIPVNIAVKAMEK